MFNFKQNIQGVKSLIDMSKGYFLTTIINQAIPFLLLPILTRYLSTEEYGILSLFNFYLAVSNAIVGASIPNVISKYFFDNEKTYVARLVGNCIYTSAMILFVAEIIIASTYYWIQLYLSVPFVWMLLLPICSFAFVIFSLGLVVCRNNHKVFHFGCHQIGNTVGNLIISLILICLFAWGWIGRAVGIIGAFLLSAGVMLVYLRRQGYLIWRYDKTMQKEIRNVVLPLIPNSLQLTIISQVGLFFMQLYFAKDILGIYALGFQIAYCVKLLIVTIQMSWSPFMYQQLAKQENMDKIYVSRLLCILFFALIGGAVVVWLLTKPVLWLMTTPDYYGAYVFVPWFALGLIFYGMYIFLNPILIKYNQQKFIGITSFISMIVMLLANIFFAKWFGYMGIVYAYCITYIFMSVTLIIKAQKVFPLPWLRALKFGKK